MKLEKIRCHKMETVEYGRFFFTGTENAMTILEFPPLCL